MPESSVTDWISAITGIIGVLASTAIGYFTYRATRQVKAARTDLAEMQVTERQSETPSHAQVVTAAAFGDDEFDADEAEANGGARWTIQVEPTVWLPPGAESLHSRPDFYLVNGGRPVFNVQVAGVSSTDQAALHLPPMPVDRLGTGEGLPIDVKRKVDSPPVIVVEIRWQNEDTTEGVARRLLASNGQWPGHENLGARAGR